MYHYVRPYSADYPYFNNLSVDDFIQQLKTFDLEDGFLTKYEFLELIQKGENKDGAVLTFDDGFKDHYNYVYPELEKRGLFGIFYIPTNIYKIKKLLPVHRVHYLKGKFNAKDLLDEAYKHISDDMLEHSKIDEFDKEIYADQNNTEHEHTFKRLFNYFLKHAVRDNLLDKLMENYFDEERLFDKVYMSKDELIDMENNGHIIGSHTQNHPVLSRLTYEEQYKEIKGSFDYLKDFLSLDIKSFCYPYGERSTYDKNTLKILEELDVHYSFIVGNEEIDDNNIKFKYELPRIDCIHI